MKAVEIKKDVYWVGAIDYNVRNFHGYITPRGTTYNAYLVVDEKTALIDTVKSPFKEELLARIRSVMDPAELDYLIVNHVEMDHSGSSAAVMEAAPEAQVIATGKGMEFLHAHYHGSEKWDIKAVDKGDSLKLGKRSLQFIPSPMLHWPDTMFTYCPEERILFSNDGFGQHIATPQRFHDEVEDRDIIDEAKKYYANILLPFSSLVSKKLAELKDVPVDIVCPSHGVAFRRKEDIEQVVSAYSRWAAGESLDKAVIIYDTMYSSTEKMARAIEDGLIDGGVDTRFYNLRISDWSEIAKEVLDAKAIVVGSATLNNGPLPTVAGFLTYLKSLRPKGKIAAAFGSYGWGGGAVKVITEYLESTGIELVEEPIQTRFVPPEEVLSACWDMGARIAKKIKER